MKDDDWKWSVDHKYATHEADISGELIFIDSTQSEEAIHIPPEDMDSLCLSWIAYRKQQWIKLMELRGYAIDGNVNPTIAYVGPRFRPTVVKLCPYG